MLLFLSELMSLSTTFTMTLICILLLSALLWCLSFSTHLNACIWNSTEAKPHSRPYMVSIQSNNEHVCGGFLVSDRFVMSAAHCINKPQIVGATKGNKQTNNEENLTAVVGAHNLKSSDFIRIKVKDYKIHPNYSLKTKCYHNDIMLLELQTPAIQSKTVSWISISKQDKDVGIKCSIAGWGGQSINGKVSDRLMEAFVRVADSTVCKSSWGTCYEKSKLCAGGSQHGAAKGDSGGPLVCNETAVGIVSFIYTETKYSVKPNVFTKICAFIPWINEIINGTK